MEGSGLRMGEEGPIPPCRNSWVKQLLLHFRNWGFRNQRDGTDSEGQSEQVDSTPRLRKCLLLAAFVLLVLTLMVLLLFWNYQYIIVWKLLHSQEYTSFPVFGGMEEEEDG